MRAAVASERHSMDWSVPTLEAVAKFFGVHADTPRAWRTGADPMPGSPGRWDLSAIAQWRARRTERGGLSDELKAVEIRLKTAQATAKEIENRERQGELVELAEVERWAANALIEAREQMMSLPETLATSSPPALREFVLSESDRHVRDVLLALRRRLESDEFANGDGGATRRTHRIKCENPVADITRRR